MVDAFLFSILLWLFTGGPERLRGRDLSRRMPQFADTPEPPFPPVQPPTTAKPSTPRPAIPATPAVPLPPSTIPASTTAPWPQVVPAGLPPFPGAGWVPDSPPGAGVVARAQSLLSELWRHGAGTFKTEQTAGRWVTYKASPMGAKKGVVAYRLANQAAAATAPAPARTVPASSPAPARSSMALPTLRRGSRGNEVKTLQSKLGITADGIFGAGTESSVRAFQARHGLQVDGIVGRQTWGALFGAA